MKRIRPLACAWTTLALCAALVGPVAGCKTPESTQRRIEETLAKKKAREEAAAREAREKEKAAREREAREAEARRRAATVQERSGAIAVGEPLEPFVQMDAVTEDAELREGLLHLRRGRPTKGLLARLKADKAAGRAAILRAMWHEQPNVRSQAPSLLSVTGAGGDAVLAAFRRSLRKEPDRDVRAQVAKALVTVQLKALGPLLVELLRRDDEPQVRANAAYALGAMGYKPAVDALVAALADKETWVRLRSVTALRRLKARKAALSLEHALSDPNVLVRQAAVRALKAVTGKRYKERTPRLSL